MVQTADLPAGFQPYAPLTGPMNAERAQLLGIDMSQLGSQEEWVRTWASRTGEEVIETAADAGTRDAAQAGTLPPGTTMAIVPGQAPVTAQSLGADLGTAGLVLVALGAIIFRSARRLGSVDARRLMLRDPRPPVLYLRSFGDDRLKLWTATFGRPSLIERFTLRRFDTFEEVLVRYLSRHGPVIAVNPPGTRLAPLGAARETIDSADWQSAVAGYGEIWTKFLRCCFHVHGQGPSQEANLE